MLGFLWGCLRVGNGLRVRTRWRVRSTSEAVALDAALASEIEATAFAKIQTLIEVLLF